METLPQDCQEDLNRLLDRVCRTGSASLIVLTRAHSSVTVVNTGILGQGMTGLD